MTPLIYLLVAIEALGLAARAYVADRADPARQAFLGLGLSLALSYTGFSLSLLPGLESFRYLAVFAGCYVPATALWTIDRAFFRDDPTPTKTMKAVYWTTLLVAPVLNLIHITMGSPFGSPASVLAGVLSTAAFVVALQRLWEAQAYTTLRVDRTRMRYLFGTVSAAAGFATAEHLGRAVVPVVDSAALSLSSRSVVLQGPLPPFGAVFAGLAIYFLFHTVVMSRLLDLNELLSRAATLLLSAAALVLIDGLTFAWVDTFTAYPFHSTFQLFLASLLFLAAYDPLREQISWWANHAFDRRGHQLLDTLHQVRRQLPTLITKEALTDALLDALHGSGRVPTCSVYLWDARHQAFVCAGVRGQGEHRPLQRVAAHPFTDRFSKGTPWYTRLAVQRRAMHDPEQAETLALMDAMNADLTLPFVSGRSVLGWFHLRDEQWTDGYPAEEILQLQDVASRASVVLANIRDFQELEEQRRLAALGAMAAGLAHEIRNPLAGLKGAAQFLQAEDLAEDSQEMLQVILDEADRLNIVVSQFLDYARPFELSLREEHLNALVTHSLRLLEAQGLPPGVTVEEELSGALPPLKLDATRVTQVLLNLLQNAVQAMPAGGTLRVRTRKTRDHKATPVVEVEVSDSGPGVPDEISDKLFVPFFTTKSGGSGLGLPICQRIVDAHGGEIDLRSSDQGATFIMRLSIRELGVEGEL